MAIRMRQPLAQIIVIVKSDEEKEILYRHEREILDELNVKKLLVTCDVSSMAAISLRLSSFNSVLLRTGKKKLRTLSTFLGE